MAHDTAVLSAPVEGGMLVMGQIANVPKKMDSFVCRCVPRLSAALGTCNRYVAAYIHHAWAVRNGLERSADAMHLHFASLILDVIITFCMLLHV